MAEAATGSVADSDGFDRPKFVISADGLRLALYDLGGAGPDILLVHATGFCAGVWAPVVKRLRGFHVTAVDIRGHGRSEAPPLEDGPGMSWEGTGRDVLTAIDELGLVHPIGVGHSMGGASLMIAELTRPGTLRSCWAFEPIVFPSELADGPNPLAEGARRRRDTFPSAEVAFANYAGKPPFDVLDPDGLAAYVEHGFEQAPDGSVTLRCRPEVEAATFENGPRHHTFDRLGEITTPTTVARGSDATPGPASMALYIVERLPNATLEDHPDLGHFGPLQDPPAIARSIMDAAAPDTRQAGPPS